MNKPEGLSIYSRCFDETNGAWKRSPEMNRVFLESQQAYFNHMLRRDGFVFLNEVYQALGFPRSSQGQIVGWLVNSEEGDGYIDFGLYMNPDFIREMEASVWLDFNVDGVIYDKIDQPQRSPMGEEVTETTETTTTEVKAPEPSTPAQELVDEVHEKVEETAPVVEETTTTTTVEKTESED